MDSTKTSTAYQLLSSEAGFGRPTLPLTVKTRTIQRCVEDYDQHSACPTLQKVQKKTPSGLPAFIHEIGQDGLPF